MQPLRPIIFNPEIPEIRLIDQTLLPGEFREISVRDIDTLADAIRRLVVRGAPALGIAGACGVALAAKLSNANSYQDFLEEMNSVAEMLKDTRPTAVNLFYGIDKVMASLIKEKSIEKAISTACIQAMAISEEDKNTCHAIGEHGSCIIPDGATILTHCNAGALACAEWGTALGVIRSAFQQGKNIRVFACETRPLLQGARLTSWELARDGIDVTVITDSMAAYLMQQKKIDVVVVGADRVVSDAVFNKIGTYMHAVCAKFHSIPFYIAAPLSTFDESAYQQEIEVEERKGDEISRCGDKILVADGIPVYNPAFDSTPMELITGIITEYGIIHLPEEKRKISDMRMEQRKGVTR